MAVTADEEHLAFKWGQWADGGGGIAAIGSLAFLWSATASPSPSTFKPLQQQQQKKRGDPARPARTRAKKTCVLC